MNDILFCPKCGSVSFVKKVLFLNQISKDIYVKIMELHPAT